MKNKATYTHTHFQSELWTRHNLSSWSDVVLRLGVVELITNTGRRRCTSSILFFNLDGLSVRLWKVASDLGPQEYVRCREVSMVWYTIFRQTRLSKEMDRQHDYWLFLGRNQSTPALIIWIHIEPEKKARLYPAYSRSRQRSHDDGLQSDQPCRPAAAVATTKAN